MDQCPPPSDALDAHAAAVARAAAALRHELDCVAVKPTAQKGLSVFATKPVCFAASNLSGQRLCGQITPCQIRAGTEVGSYCGVVAEEASLGHVSSYRFDLGFAKTRIDVPWHPC